jgi:hypothetical protein
MAIESATRPAANFGVRLLDVCGFVFMVGPSCCGICAVECDWRDVDETGMGHLRSAKQYQRIVIGYQRGARALILNNNRDLAKVCA